MNEGMTRCKQNFSVITWKRTFTWGPNDWWNLGVCHDLKMLRALREVVTMGLQDSLIPKHMEALFPKFLHCFTDYYKPPLMKQVYLRLVK